MRGEKSRVVAATEEEEERGPSYQMKESTREERRKEGGKNQKVSFPAEGRLPFSLSLAYFFLVASETRVMKKGAW